MARISKTEHSRILHLIDNERRRVADVALEYGCTPANIYVLLGKLRRSRAEPAILTVDATASDLGPAAAPEDTTSSDARAGGAGDLFVGSATSPPMRSTKRDVTAIRPVASDDAVVQDPRAASDPAARTSPFVSQAGVARAAPAVPTGADAPDQARPTALSSAGVGAKLAKPGFSLVMRTAEGDENVTPFRSLEDLLSAAKFLLRTAARSPDPVWFSVQPVDLSTLELDAA